MNKVCTQCKVTSDIDNFSLRKHKSGKSYRNSWCKSCCAERERNRRANKRVYKRKKKAEYDVNHPKKIMITSARTRARKLNLEFNITVDDFEIPTHCPILGIPLIKGKGKVGSNSPSLDRIICDRGYVKGNVQVISYKANTMKSNATMFELYMFAKWIAKSMSLDLIYKKGTHVIK